MRKLGLNLLGLLILIGAMEAVGRLELAGNTWPPISKVFSYARTEPGTTILTRAIEATAAESALGLMFGVLIGLGVAALGLLAPFLRAGLNQAAVLLSALPLIALGPVLITTVGSGRTPVVIAAIGAGFTVYVTVSSAFARVPDATRDVFAVLGAGRRTVLGRLVAPTSVPALLDAIALAAPAALLGATIGEWFGAPRGIGVLLVTSMQNYAIEQLWAAAISVSLISLLVYLALTSIQRVAAGRFA